MQGLAHNLPIRQMDVKDGVIEGGTEEAGGDDQICLQRRGNFN